MKTCGNCKAILTEVNASRVLSGKQSGQFQSYCRKCSVEYNRNRRAKNPEPYKEASRKWYSNPENKIKRASYQKLRQVEAPEKVKLTNRKCKLKRLYGISPDEFDRLLKSQGDVCAICKSGVLGCISQGKQFKTRAFVDHCHTTGKVRGLLCSKCNFMVGLADDSPSRLREAAAYLEKA